MATIGPTRLWAIVALFETWRGLGACGQLQCGSLYDGALATYYGLVQAVAFVAVLVKPSSSQLFVAAMVLRLLPFLPKFPFVWDSDYWGLQTDAAVVFFLLRYSEATACVGTTVRLQMGIFYLAAGAWKLDLVPLAPDGRRFLGFFLKNCRDWMVGALACRRRCQQQAQSRGPGAPSVYRSPDTCL